MSSGTHWSNAFGQTTRVYSYSRSDLRIAPATASVHCVASSPSTHSSCLKSRGHWHKAVHHARNHTYDFRPFFQHRSHGNGNRIPQHRSFFYLTTHLLIGGGIERESRVDGTRGYYVCEGRASPYSQRKGRYSLLSREERHSIVCCKDFGRC